MLFVRSFVDFIPSCLANQFLFWNGFRGGDELHSVGLELQVIISLVHWMTN